MGTVSRDSRPTRRGRLYLEFLSASGRKPQTERLNAASKEKTCAIGKPVEIIDVEPLSLPMPLRREKEAPVERPGTVEVPVAETTVEPVTTEKL